jgi:diguanylate cyclase
MVSAASVVTDAVKSIHTRLWRTKPPVDRKMEPKSPYLETFDTLRTYVERYDIDPNPANYTLLYRHYVRGEANLATNVMQLIEMGYAPDFHDLVDKDGFSEEDLQSIADSAQEQLKALELLTLNSHADARGFSDALEGRAQVMANDRAGSSAIAALMDLTRTMIVKVRAAEQELRARGEAMSDLQASLVDARSKADTDSLTGLSNRRAFERMLGAVSDRAVLTGRPLSLAICDVDHFKSINDRFGHVTGDRVLKLIGTILADHCGKKGHVFRFGGEEFVILFEELAIQPAYELVDAARRDLADRHIVKKETGEALGPITISAGVGGLPPAQDACGLLRIADRALYAAKANGRNCAMHAERGLD